MKFNEKAQQVIEYLLIVVAVVGAVMGAAVPFKDGTERALNRAIATIYESYTWRFGEAGDCTSDAGTILTCGLGTANRSVWCQRDDDMAKVADAYCEAQAGPKPSETVSCNAGACGTFNWVGSGYGECSRDCDGGTQSQDVVCKNSSGEIVDDSNCASSGAKPVSRACNETPCFSWVSGSTCVTACTAPCDGVGTCEPEIVCRDNLSGSKALDAKCEVVSPKPTFKISCEGMKCDGYEWLPGGWGACKTAMSGCGKGTQKQEVKCVKSIDKTEVDASLCDPTKKPLDTMDCDLGACYSWVLGGWGPCSTICNSSTMTGTQITSVQCKDRLGAVVADANCAGLPKPLNTRVCPGNPLCTFSWGTKEDWSICSNNCGSGTQTRTVTCTRTNDGMVTTDLTDCLNSLGPVGKPESSRPCTGKCYKWNLSWGPCSKSCGRGTHTRTTYSCKDNTGAIVDNSNCSSAVGLFAPGATPPSSESCLDVSGCCGNGSCEKVDDWAYTETCETCAKDCLTSCWWSGTCCKNDGKCNTGENCSNSLKDCGRITSPWMNEYCGPVGSPCAGQMLQTHEITCGGVATREARCWDDPSCSFGCTGLMSINAVECPNARTGISARFPWTYGACDGTKCRASCRSGYYATSDGSACLAYCGDGMCNYGETCSSCADCQKSYSGYGCASCGALGYSSSPADGDGDYVIWCNLPPGYNGVYACGGGYGFYINGYAYCYGTHLGDLFWFINPPCSSSTCP